MGNTILSVGTRHVRLWNIEEHASASPLKTINGSFRKTDHNSLSQGPKVLQGRNCILGSMVDACFTSVAAITQETALVGTTDGDLCFLDASNEPCTLKRIHQCPFEITSLALDNEGQQVAISGKGGNVVSIPCAKLSSEEAIDSYGMSICTQGDVLALGYLDHAPIMIKSDRTICVGTKGVWGLPGYTGVSEMSPCYEDGSAGSREASVKMSIEADSKHADSKTEHHSANDTDLKILMKSHPASVLGVRTLTRQNRFNSEFLTYSSDGSVTFWTRDGEIKQQLKVRLGDSSEEIDENTEMQALEVSPNAEVLVYGDSVGCVALMSNRTTSIRAHDGEVNAITLASNATNGDLVASCGRDKVIQVFRNQDHGFNLIQSIVGEHVGAVNCIALSQDGVCLISASADRTIVVRFSANDDQGRSAFIQLRVINLKATPLTLSLNTGCRNDLVVSTMDRQVVKFDSQSGQLLEAFKAADGLGSTDAFTLNICKIFDLKTSSGFTHLIVVGASSIDKSLRIYDPTNGALLAKGYGQLGISDVNLMRSYDTGVGSTYRIVTTGFDGTIFLWKLDGDALFAEEASPGIKTDKNMHSTPPLRKVLSKVEIRDFHRHLESSSAPTTPTNRRRSPTRLRKKPSQLKLSRTPRQALPVIPSVSYKQDPSGSASTSPSMISLKAMTPPKSSSSSNESENNKTGVPSSVSEINELAENVCNTLRAFRRSIQDSLPKLSSSMQANVLHELSQSIAAIGSVGVTETQMRNEQRSTDSSFDDYLANLIDQRLALRQLSSSHDEVAAANTGLPARRTSITGSGAKDDG